MNINFGVKIKNVIHQLSNKSVISQEYNNLEARF